MLTIEEARSQQKRAEVKTVLFFFISFIVGGVATTILFLVTDWLTISPAFWAIPTLLAMFIIYKSNIAEFLKPREFVGRISDIYAFRTRDKIVKGAGWGYGPNVGAAYLVVEITVRSEKTGRTIDKAYRNNEIVSKLSIGDEIVILRFVSMPVVLSMHANHPY